MASGKVHELFCFDKEGGVVINIEQQSHAPDVLSRSYVGVIDNDDVACGSAGGDGGGGAMMAVLLMVIRFLLCQFL